MSSPERKNRIAVPLTRLKQPVLLTRRKSPARATTSPGLQRMSSAVVQPITSPGVHPAQHGRAQRVPVQQQPAPRGRVYERWPQLVHVTLESEHNFFCGFFREVGSAGLFIATYTNVPLGEVMLVGFTVPGHDATVSAICEARWLREFSDRTQDAIPGVGFAFMRIESAALSAVERFMTAREPIFWEG